MVAIKASKLITKDQKNKMYGEYLKLNIRCTFEEFLKFTIKLK